MDGKLNASEYKRHADEFFRLTLDLWIHEQQPSWWNEQEYQDWLAKQKNGALLDERDFCWSKWKKFVLVNSKDVNDIQRIMDSIDCITAYT